MEKEIDLLYEELRGLPSQNAIVRNGHREDAFEVLTLKVLYGKRFHLSFEKEHATELAQYIPAPPDNGIDIFVEEENGDESHFDVIQVKHAKLTEADIKASFLYMKSTIKEFCKNPTNVKSESCREVLSKSSLDRNNRKNCRYFVVHIGDLHGSITDKDDEIVLNLLDFEIIMQSRKDKVVKESINIEGDESTMFFGSKTDKQYAVVCSVNCYDLAVLEGKYYSTEVGRNILFGHNLRESLRKSKSYEGMLKTIKKEPENFWYYNNGITIVADDVNIENGSGSVIMNLTQFSIVNGAQTTSTLGRILRDAIRDKKTDLIESLKKAFVIARVLKVKDDDVQQSIAIYNNTQNPINSRDMVANNPEQIELHERLVNDTYPQIFMEIRRGSHYPQSFNKLYAHRITTNEILAQLAYAGFLLQPYMAKDKKASIFNPDYSQEQYVLNETYHKVFNIDQDLGEKGILQEKTKYEIDELLFAQQLYKESKGALKKKYQDRIDVIEETKKTATPDVVVECDAKIKVYSQRLETIGICMVYFVTTYYEFAMEFGATFSNKRYEYDKFYSDKGYRSKMIQEVANFFLSKTVDILLETAEANNKAANINNWVRSAACESAYKKKISNMISSDLSLEESYRDFMGKYKVIPI